MEWSEVNKFIKESGGRALIIVDGQPALVVMGYQDYRRLETGSDNLPMISEKPAESGFEPESKASQEDHVPEKKGVFIDDLPL